MWARTSFCPTQTTATVMSYRRLERECPFVGFVVPTGESLALTGDLIVRLKSTVATNAVRQTYSSKPSTN
jgi:hypothetical protein